MMTRSVWLTFAALLAMTATGSFSGCGGGAATGGKENAKGGKNEQADKKDADKKDSTDKKTDKKNPDGDTADKNKPNGDKPKTNQDPAVKPISVPEDLPVDDLVAALADAAKRDSAAGRLAAKGASSVAPLRASLEKLDSPGKAAAAFALGQIGKEAQAAVPDLEKLAASSDEVVADAARFALDAIAGK